MSGKYITIKWAISYGAAFGDDETQELPGGDPEHTLLLVELDMVGVEVGEGFL